MKKYFVLLAFWASLQSAPIMAAADTNVIVEMAPFNINQGVSEAELLKASEILQTEFLGKQKGFIKRELLHEGERSYIDIVHWASKEDAQAALKASEVCTPCAVFFGLMEMPDANNPNAGVQHLRPVQFWQRLDK